MEVMHHLNIRDANGAQALLDTPADASTARFWEQRRRSAWQMITRRSVRFSKMSASGLAYCLQSH